MAVSQGRSHQWSSPELVVKPAGGTPVWGPVLQTQVSHITSGSMREENKAVPKYSWVPNPPLKGESLSDRIDTCS